MRGRHGWVGEGVIAGLLGATAVALWFLVIDLTTRELFFTPAALGSALFKGARGVAEVEIGALTVGGYTIIHFAAFVLVGLLASYLATKAERHGIVLVGAILLLVTLETLFLGLGAIVASWLLAALNGWIIFGANVLAAAVMGWYLWRAHPGLRAQLSRDHDESDFADSGRGARIG